MKFPRWAATVTAVVFAGTLACVQAPTASAATFTAELVARNSQKCVSVSGASTQNGADAVQWDCVEGTNQHFRLG
ncbi:RICIN domain-containing protein [Streptomyces scopuliridis]|uniref:RICIN domain-containing protein n=1 Tax=Streptomyces scopuliridis TaxID=452529 RepID=UPI0036848D01